MIGLGEKLARCPPIVVTIDGYHRGRQLRPPAFDLFEQLLAVHPVMLKCSAMTEMGHEEQLPPGRLRVCYESDSSRSRRVPSVMCNSSNLI